MKGKGRSPENPTVKSILAQAASSVPLEEAPPVLSDAPDAAPVDLAPPPALLETAPGPVGGESGAGAGLGEGRGSGSGEGRGTGQGTGIGSGRGGGAGPGDGSGLDVLRAIYLREHFSYIRQRIARNLVYPPCAIRAGWAGCVRLSFVILEDGRIRDLHVVRSSGVPLLDRDAQETVHRSTPFPKPPVSAGIVIPVEYSIE